ncbi:MULTISPECIES: YdbL family protein [Desulfosediminicola]|uniref:YdbL family protein n=1 Tax=Desulfosediminicola TaxID=2886823 RepID=UPI0010AC6728|nr:YdbL family protein [Desulfosediminicola ganghwensis]
MRKKFTFLPILLILFALAIGSTTVLAASIKDRMASRLPTITALKDQGTIGENNKGLLEYRSGNKPEQATVNAENQDRSKVYAAISKKEGVSATLVGERRAKRIAEIGQAGHWFQDGSGKWYKK